MNRESLNGCTKNDQPSEAERGPDCLCELLVDLVVVPLAQLDVSAFQAWVHTTSICVALLKQEALRHWWIQRIASRMVLEFPAYQGGPPQAVADFACRLLHAPGEWAAWKADYAPELKDVNRES